VSENEVTELMPSTVPPTVAPKIVFTPAPKVEKAVPSSNVDKPQVNHEAMLRAALKKK